MQQKFTLVFVIAIFLLFVSSFEKISAQYCSPSASSGTSSGDYIETVQFDSIYSNSGATASSPYFTFYSSQSTTIYADSSYYIKITCGTTSSDNNIAVWIDFNHNDSFESDEKIGEINNMSGSTTDSIFIKVPYWVDSCQTRMRVRETWALTSLDPCTSYTFGEAEDYIINIRYIGCSSTPSVGKINAYSNYICQGQNDTIFLTGHSGGGGHVFTWQTSPDSTNWTTIATTKKDYYIYYIDSVDEYIRCYVVCNGFSDTSLSLYIKKKNFYECYCNIIHSNSCDTNDMITKVSITGKNLNSTVNSCTGVVSSYWFFNPAGSNTDTLVGDSTYTFNITSSAKNIISMWIDYNKDGNFDTSEWTQVTTSSAAYSSNKVKIKIPLSADTGFVGLRIRSCIFTSLNGATDACTVFGSGSTQDYVIYIYQNPCSSSPNAGIVIPSQNTACTNDIISFNLSGNTYGLGQSYQWQSSSDSISWKNVSGATKSSFTDTFKGYNIYIRCYIVCGGNADTSAFTQIEKKVSYLCYCFPEHSQTCDTTDMITNVQIEKTKLNSAITSCANSYKNNYWKFKPAGNNTATVFRGNTYTLNVTTSSYNNISAWIDFDHSGTFDSAEWTKVTIYSLPWGVNKISIDIPSSADTGFTGMRIRSKHYGPTNNYGSACTAFSSGTTHDYLIKIIDKPSKDLLLDEILKPKMLNGCLSSKETIELKLLNTGSDTLNFSIDSVKISVKISNGISKTLDSVLSSGYIAPDSVLKFQFTDSVDMSGLNTTYNIQSFLYFANDSNHNNDSEYKSISTFPLYSLPYIQNFDSSVLIPELYTKYGWYYNAGAGKSGKGSLAINTSTSLASTAESNIAGPLTKKSAIRFDYLAVKQFPSGDTVSVEFSVDCGKTFSKIISFHNSNTGFAIYKSFQYKLGAFAGSNIFVRFKAKCITGNFIFNIDNFSIGDVPEIFLGNDTSVCDSIILLGNPKKLNAIVEWGVSGMKSDSLIVQTSGKYIAKITDSKTLLYNYDTINVTVYRKPSLSVADTSTLCSGSYVLISAGVYPSNYKYLWSTGDTANYKLFLSGGGNYWLKVSNPVCYDSVGFYIKFHNQPSGVDIIKGTVFNGKYNSGTINTPDEICVGNTLSYEILPPSKYTNNDYGTKWTFLGNPIFVYINGWHVSASSYNYSAPSSSSNAQLIFTPSDSEQNGVFYFKAILKDSITGCDTSIIRYIKVNGLPKVDIGADQTICPDKKAVFDAGNFVKYLWNNGDTAETISTSIAGTYFVEITDTNGCVSFDTAELILYNKPYVNIGTDQNICQGNIAVLDAGITSNGIYLWSTGTTNRTINVSSTGNYWVRTTDFNGCHAFDTATITVLPKPDATFSAIVLSPTANIKFKATDTTLAMYNWDFGDGNTGTNNYTNTHLYTSDGNYIVRLKTSDNAGCSDSITNAISVNTGINLLYYIKNIQIYPNPFTEKTYIQYELISSENITINLMDITGKIIQNIENKNQSMGIHSAEIFTPSAGIYLLRIITNRQQQTFRLMDWGNK